MEDLVREERLTHRQHLGSTWFSGKRLHGGIDSPRGGLVGTGPKVMVY
jgi:hypothetical protein